MCVCPNGRLSPGPGTLPREYGPNGLGGCVDGAGGWVWSRGEAARVCFRGSTAAGSQALGLGAAPPTEPVSAEVDFRLRGSGLAAAEGGGSRSVWPGHLRTPQMGIKQDSVPCCFSLAGGPGAPEDGGLSPWTRMVFHTSRPLPSATRSRLQMWEPLLCPWLQPQTT